MPVGSVERDFMRKQIVGIVRKHVIMLLAGTAVGLLLLYLVYCLPVGSMREHVRQSLPMLQREFETENLIQEYPGTFMGAYTDCLMLENAIYQSEEHSMLEQILCMYRAESGTGAGWAPGYSLVDYLEGSPQPVEVTYARYWHGYLVALKPMLLLTSFTTLRLIAAWVQLLLLGGGSIIMHQKERKLSGSGVAGIGSLFILCQPLRLSVFEHLLLYPHGSAAGAA